MSQTIHSGSVTGNAGVAVKLSSTRIEARWVMIQAKFDNSANIVIRGVGEQGGIELPAYSTLTLPAMSDLPHYNLKEVEMVASVNGEGANLLWYAGE